MKASLPCLLEACRARGIPLSPQRHTRQELLSLLTHHAFGACDPSYGLASRISLESLMLCASFHELSGGERHSVMHDAHWIAEPKYYGCRCLATYHPDEGFRFFSRNISLDSFLPLEYTQNLLIPFPGRTLPQSWRKAYPQPFVLDGELYSSRGAKKKSPRDAYYTLEGNYVSLLMQIPTEESHQLQLEQFPLRFSAFDLLHLGEDPVWPRPLRARKALLHSLMTGQLFPGAPIPFEETPYTSEDKTAYLARQLREGMEGCVLKNLDKPYLPSAKRCRDTMVRVKPRSDSVIEDLDVFVTGVQGTRAELSVFLRDPSGFEREEVVGAVTIPKRLRRALRAPQFHQNFFHRPVPNSEVIGRVLVVRAVGYDPAHRRFGELRADWATGFRSDKSPMDCVLDPGSLEARWLCGTL